MSHDLNLYFIHLPQCALFRRIKGPNSGFVPSRPQTRKTDANRSQCRRMPPKSPKKCSVMMCDVGCHIQCGFSKNSEGATIFGTPAESASEQWVAHTHTHSPTHTHKTVQKHVSRWAWMAWTMFTSLLPFQAFEKPWGTLCGLSKKFKQHQTN